MEQVGQHALAVHVRARRAGIEAKQPSGHAEVVEETTHHRQHALVAPAIAIAAELEHAVFPARLIAEERVELAERKADRRGSKRVAHEPPVFRFGASGEPLRHLGGLLAHINGVLVGQVHRAHAALAERGADGLGLVAVVDEHSHVSGTQRAAPSFPSKPAALRWPRPSRRTISVAQLAAICSR